MEEKEITFEEYVLTNINPDGYYVIRLKDDKEYIVYHKKPKGQKSFYFIKQNDKEIKLSDEVKKSYLSEVREYEYWGI